MLQKVRQLNDKSAGIALYVSLDNPYFFSRSIIDVVGEFSRLGGKYLFLDEVHKYPSKNKDYDWSAEVKASYDQYPGIYITYSGSSVLIIYKGQGDLSRRKSTYKMRGLSFREFLFFEDIMDTPAIKLEEILKDHVNISKEIITKTKIFPHFIKYLNYGYYPFYRESLENYYDRLRSVMNVIMETDIPSVAEISYETIFKIKQLLAVLATSVPYTPNLTNVRSKLFISDQRTLLNYLNLLEKAEIITTLGKEATGNRILNKPDKIFLNNTNLINAIDNRNVQTGTARETFFQNQISEKHKLKYPVKGDFMVDNIYVFEIGGKNKDNSQINDQENAWIAMDNIEIGFGKTIPLWMFGFTY
jgi:predicted AAA+ superfamily ATPase